VTSNRLEDNPFFNIELPVIAIPRDVERAGQKLLALLAVGAASSPSIRKPLGTRERDENKVRAAVATLRNPEERLLNECGLVLRAPGRRRGSPCLVDRVSKHPLERAVHGGLILLVILVVRIVLARRRGRPLDLSFAPSL